MKGVEILVIPPGGREPIYRWPGNGKPAGGLPAQTDWRELSLAIVDSHADRPDRARSQPSVLVCLRANGVVGFGWNELRDLLSDAHRHIWGAHIYVVLDLDAGESESTRAEQPASVDKWFEVLESDGVTDLIQFNGVANDGPIDVARLAAELDRVDRRVSTTRELLHGISYSLPWYCKCFPPDYGSHPLINDYVDRKPARPHNRVLVLSDDAAVGVVKKRLRDSFEGRQVVAVVDPCQQAKVTQRLREVEQDGAVKVLGFARTSELRFFLQQLTAHAFAIQPESSDNRVVEVSLSEPRFFDAYNLSAKPSILLTNSFHASKDKRACVAAGLDVGEIMQGVPRTAWRGAHRAVDIPGFRHVLSSGDVPKHLTAWLHLGHGYKNGSLEEYARVPRTPAEWLRCFRDGGWGVALAFFSSCYSLEAARLFAEAGAGVAIGFARSVDPETCRILSAPVIRAALRSNGSPPAILDAFRKALAHGRLKAEPRAFSSFR